MLYTATSPRTSLTFSKPTIIYSGQELDASAQQSLLMRQRQHAPGYPQHPCPRSPGRTAVCALQDHTPPPELPHSTQSSPPPYKRHLALCSCCCIRAPIPGQEWPVQTQHHNCLRNSAMCNAATELYQAATSCDCQASALTSGSTGEWMM